jgi:hypothetical protein
MSRLGKKNGPEADQYLNEVDLLHLWIGIRDGRGDGLLRRRLRRMREGDKGGRCSLYLSSTSHSLPRGIKENAVTHAGSPRGITPFVGTESQHEEQDGVGHH